MHLVPGSKQSLPCHYLGGLGEGWKSAVGMRMGMGMGCHKSSSHVVGCVVVGIDWWGDLLLY